MIEQLGAVLDEEAQARMQVVQAEFADAPVAESIAPDNVAAEAADDEQLVLDYTHNSGERHSGTAKEIIGRCPYLGKLALQGKLSNEQLLSVAKLSARGQQLAAEKAPQSKKLAKDSEKAQQPTKVDKIEKTEKVETPGGPPQLPEDMLAEAPSVSTPVPIHSKSSSGKNALTELLSVEREEAVAAVAEEEPAAETPPASKIKETAAQARIPEELSVPVPVSTQPIEPERSIEIASESPKVIDVPSTPQQAETVSEYASLFVSEADGGYFAPAAADVELQAGPQTIQPVAAEAIVKASAPVQEHLPHHVETFLPRAVRRAFASIEKSAEPEAEAAVGAICETMDQLQEHLIAGDAEAVEALEERLGLLYEDLCSRLEVKCDNRARQSFVREVRVRLLEEHVEEQALPVDEGTHEFKTGILHMPRGDTANLREQLRQQLARLMLLASIARAQA